MFSCVRKTIVIVSLLFCVGCSSLSLPPETSSNFNPKDTQLKQVKADIVLIGKKNTLVLSIDNDQPIYVVMPPNVMLSDIIKFNVHKQKCFEIHKKCYEFYTHDGMMFITEKTARSLLENLINMDGINEASHAVQKGSTIELT